INRVGQEKTWFTDEPENTHLRNLQINPVNTLTVNPVGHNKSTSSLIPTIREAEDEC
ncbi:Calcium-activated potassium channel subunit alpha-1, partial [Ataeniobius toweri]|nr:Calcium-activated potassium channel subunit alpha-1 [Ataeniobius toweri]